MNYTFRISYNSSVLLDLIRFLAAEMVVVGHGIWEFNFYNRMPGWPPLQDLAVLVFFILSGFLISFTAVSKMSERNYSFKEFFIDRFSRIYTAFIPCLLVILVLDIFSIKILQIAYRYPYTLNVKTFFGNLLMLQDHPVLMHAKYFFMQDKSSIVYMGDFGSARPLWSVAVEWWLYLGFGWLVIKNAGNKRLLYYFLLLIFAAVPFYNLFMGGKTDGLTVVWIMGCMLTIVLNQRLEFKSLASGFLSFVLGILAWVTAFRFTDGYNLLTAALFTLSIYFMVMAANKATRQIPQILGKIVKGCAGFSFTLYLVHFSFLELFLFAFKQYSEGTRFWLYFFISNIFSFAIAWVTEMRYRKVAEYLKNKYIHDK